MCCLQEDRVSADTDANTIAQGAYTSSVVLSTLLNSSKFAIQESYPSSPGTADCLQSPTDFEDVNSGDECGAVALFPENDRPKNNTKEHSDVVDTVDLKQSFNSFSPDTMTLPNFEQGEGYESIKRLSQGNGNVFLNFSFLPLRLLCCACTIVAIEWIMAKELRHHDSGINANFHGNFYSSCVTFLHVLFLQLSII